MKFSYVEQLRCPKCNDTYSVEQKAHLCKCGSPLLVDYDLESLRKDVSKERFEKRINSLWKYHELLPVKDDSNIITLGEGMTPIIEMNRLGYDMGISDLYMKDESIIPTGSFKARGAAVGVSKAKELGVKQLVMPTNGNAGAAWSLYAARAGIEATIIMPKGAPNITRNEVAISGSRFYLVNGLISDAGKIAGKASEKYGYYNVSTLKEPYRIEGKKTMGIELAEQFGWEVPDVILYPTGGGVGLIGIYKALKELQELGWILKEKMPRLVAVQAENCAPIVKAWEQRKTESDYWEHSETIAFGINVPKAIGDFLILEALYETDGYAIAVQDEEILKEQENVANLEGTFICPEGAACFVAVRSLTQKGWIKEGEKVVVLNTGAGIKYPNTVNVTVQTLEIGDEI